MNDPTNITVRGTILEKAKALTEGDRNAAYGSPQPNMECFAKLVGSYLTGKAKNGSINLMDLNAVDGAMIASFLKASRVAANQQHCDNYVDFAAYAAIAGECAFPLPQELPLPLGKEAENVKIK